MKMAPISGLAVSKRGVLLRVHEDMRHSAYARCPF
ncbi:conserved hypothetical protein [Agrobacterium fabacearum S56]|nr:hypothetical protein AGROH133_05912 [Agrobacterium tumefaciens]CUW96226.1 conserved hypothetical protein [Agrobacterium fabacearum S56]